MRVVHFTDFFWPMETSRASISPVRRTPLPLGSMPPVKLSAATLAPMDRITVFWRNRRTSESRSSRLRERALEKQSLHTESQLAVVIAMSRACAFHSPFWGDGECYRDITPVDNEGINPLLGQ